MAPERHTSASSSPRPDRVQSIPVQPGPVGSRRIARLVPARSAQAVLMHVVREARAPDWSPSTAAGRIEDYVRGELTALLQARSRLRAITEHKPTLVQARAIATLNMAIHRVLDLPDAEQDGAVP